MILNYNFTHIYIYKVQMCKPVTAEWVKLKIKNGSYFLLEVECEICHVLNFVLCDEFANFFPIILPNNT